MIPSVGRIVHYVSYGSPVQSDGSQTYTSECRAAVIAEVYQHSGYPKFPGAGDPQEPEPQLCALVVFNPTGLFFNDCPQDENDKVGGTWHWPERVEE